MTSIRHLSWPNFQSTVFLRGQQRVHRVTDSPDIQIFADGSRNLLGISVEIPCSLPIPPDLLRLNAISVQNIDRDGRSFLEVTTGSKSVFRQFYHFALAVAEQVVDEKKSALEAVSHEIRCFSDLIDERQFLSIERQLGLLGELLFLECLVQRHGTAALDSWLGPSGELHDFRVNDNEFEVKTTTASRRVHTVNGMDQLVASVGCTLYMASILLGPPGASKGFSLSGVVKSLSLSFADTQKRAEQFKAALEASGFVETDANNYTRTYSRRRPMAVVKVDGSFPSVTRLSIENALGPLASRIESLWYEVNVDGLEHEVCPSAFGAALNVIPENGDS